ncbi:MAG: hypothetical protein ACRC9F_00105 [Metamycoplasmataceae bacterium]
MKKLLLGLGTISLAVIPAASMVSCSSAEKTNELNITLVSDWTTVTAKAINDAIVQIKAATNRDSQSENVALIKALNLVFKGVSSDNIDDFEIITLESPLTPTITLKGKVFDGVQSTFSGSSSEDKKEISTIISADPTKTLDISLKEPINQAQIDAVANGYMGGITDLTELAALLNTIFTGFTIENLVQNPAKPTFYIEVITETGRSTKIEILAGVDYKFTDDSTLLIATATPIK